MIREFLTYRCQFKIFFSGTVHIENRHDRGKLIIYFFIILPANDALYVFKLNYIFNSIFIYLLSLLFLN